MSNSEYEEDKIEGLDSEGLERKKCSSVRVESSDGECEEMGSSGEMRYPPTLYPEGKSPLQRRSMHHNCTLSYLASMKDFIGDRVYEEIRDTSQLGVLLKLAESGFIWCAKTVHHFLTHQLAISSTYEMWSLIEGYPLRFSLHEFSDITGLNCDSIDEDDTVNVDHKDFWGDLEVDSGHGPNWKELDKALIQSRGWSAKKRKMLGLLVVLNVGIFGKSRSTRIPLEYAKRVLDAEAFERFPWGRVGFKSLIQSIKVVSFVNSGYVLHGCVHVLMVWALESVSVLGKTYGNKNVGENLPLLRWRGGRPRCTIADYLAREKKKKKKLDVIHLSVRPEGDLFPIWPDEKLVYGEGEGGKKLLDNMLDDIMNGCLDVKYCDVGHHPAIYERYKEQEKGKKNESKKEQKKEEKKEKRKKLLDESEEDDFVDPPLKKKMKLKTSTQKKGEVEETTSDGVGMERVLRMLSSLGGKFDSMEFKIHGRLDGLSDKVDGMGKKMIELESDVKILKLDRIEKNEAEPKIVDDDDECSTNKETEEMKPTSQEDFPISCLVRNPKSKSKIEPKKIIKTEPIGPVKSAKAVGKEIKKASPSSTTIKPFQGSHSIKHVGKEKKPIISTINIGREAIEPLSITKAVGNATNSAVVDLTKQLNFVYKLSDVDDVEDAQNDAFGGALDKLMDLCQKKDFVSKTNRQKNLSSTQLHPFVGSSLVKRMLKGSKLSFTAYDPFEKASSQKVDNLMAFIEGDLNNPLESSNASANFYIRIMTPKQDWPASDPKFGWITDVHLCPAMHLLRKRSMQPTTPFITTRFAFLDPWFVNQWGHDYKKWLADKKWLFRNDYFKVYDGLHPSYGITNKKWVDDVDFVYFLHNIKNEHWVALEVDLVRRRIKVFDSINAAFTDDQVFESCKPYTRMIPHLLQAMAPAPEKKSMGAQAFSIYRVKTTPQNIQEGDCGVFSIKFIECLALGITFDGLSDAAIPAIRLKLAAEMFDEVPDTDCFMQMSDPNPRGEDTGGVEFISETNI